MSASNKYLKAKHKLQRNPEVNNIVSRIVIVVRPILFSISLENNYIITPSKWVMIFYNAINACYISCYPYCPIHDALLNCPAYQPFDSQWSVNSHYVVNQVV